MRVAATKKKLPPVSKALAISANAIPISTRLRIDVEVACGSLPRRIGRDSESRLGNRQCQTANTRTPPAATGTPRHWLRAARSGKCQNQSRKSPREPAFFAGPYDLVVGIDGLLISQMAPAARRNPATWRWLGAPIVANENNTGRAAVSNPVTAAVVPMLPRESA